jgi:chromosome segregation ATPase
MSELNAESVLASIVELRKSIAEQGERSDKATAELRASIDKSNTELRASIAEQGKRMEKETAELRASIAEQGKRIDEQGKRLDAVCERLDEQGKRMDKVLDELRVNNHRVGDLSNKVGRIVEKIVLPGIVDKFNERGFKFDTVSANVEFLNEKKNGKLAELDALLENGKFVIAVETKTELTIKDVNTYIKRLQALRKISRFKGKKIYGAFSTAIAEQKSIKYALEKGFYVLQQPDVMAVRIVDFPKGRSAKAW